MLYCEVVIKLCFTWQETVYKFKVLICITDPYYIQEWHLKLICFVGVIK